MFMLFFLRLVMSLKHFKGYELSNFLGCYSVSNFALLANPPCNWEDSAGDYWHLIKVCTEAKSSTLWLFFFYLFVYICLFWVYPPLLFYNSAYSCSKNSLLSMHPSFLFLLLWNITKQCQLIWSHWDIPNPPAGGESSSGHPVSGISILFNTC